MWVWPCVWCLFILRKIEVSNACWKMLTELSLIQSKLLSSKGPPTRPRGTPSWQRSCLAWPRSSCCPSCWRRSGGRGTRGTCDGYRISCWRLPTSDWVSASVRLLCLVVTYVWKVDSKTGPCLAVLCMWDMETIKMVFFWPTCLLYLAVIYMWKVDSKTGPCLAVIYMESGW